MARGTGGHTEHGVALSRRANVMLRFHHSTLSPPLDRYRNLAFFPWRGHQLPLERPPRRSECTDAKWEVQFEEVEPRPVARPQQTDNRRPRMLGDLSVSTARLTRSRGVCVAAGGTCPSHCRLPVLAAA